MLYWTLYLAALLGASGFAVAIVAWLWRRERDLSTNLFLVIAAVQAVSGVLVTAELMTASRSLSIVVFGLQNAVLAGVTPAFFLFVLASLGYRRHLTRPVIGLVFGIFAVSGLIQLTDPVHGLYWAEYTVTDSTFHYVAGEPTNLSFLLVLPQMLFYYVAMGLLGANVLFGSGKRRRQSAALFVGFLPAFIITTIWSMGVLLGPINGALVIGGTWSLAVIAWAVFRQQLFDVVPMARETVFEALEEVVIVVDRRQRILDYNAGAAETFPELATADGGALGAVVPSIVDANGSDTGGTNSEQGQKATSVDENGVGDADHPFVDSFTRHVDGEPREYEVSVTPISVSGTTGGYAVVVRDVTERRKRVRHLRQQTAQLERFAETLSHDLRNPLSVARGRIDLAQETGKEAHLETAADALERIEQLIEDTLTLAREGQAIEDREPVELGELARNAWATTDTGEASFEVMPDAEMTVYADHSRLRTVFENLFRNAVDHSATNPDSQTRQDGVEHSSTSEDSNAPQEPAEPRSIADEQPEQPADRGSIESTPDTATPLIRGNVESEDAETTSERVTESGRTNGSGTPMTVRLGRAEDGFYVEDDGPGIPPADREDVFEYGYTTDEDGTGLGLAIVEAIANAHGWDVTATEGREGGARLVFEDVDVVEPAAQGD